MAGDFAFLNGQVPDATYLNGYVRDQTVTICTSTTRPATPVSGRVISETDTGRMLRYNGTTAAWDVVVEGEWLAWTPIVTQSATPTQASGYSRFCRMGRLLNATFAVSFTSAGTATNSIGMTVPVTMAAYVTNNALGSFEGMVGGVHVEGSVCWYTATSVVFKVTGNAPWLGTTPALTIASGDYLSGTFTAETVA